MTVIVVVVIAVTVGYAVCAGGSFVEFPGEILLHSSLHGAGHPGGNAHPKLFKELDRPATHAATEHNIGVLAVDEVGYLPDLMTGEEGVIYDLHVFDLVVFHVYQGKERAAPEMLGDDAVESIIGLC